MACVVWDHVARSRPAASGPRRLTSTGARLAGSGEQNRAGMSGAAGLWKAMLDRTNSAIWPTQTVVPAPSRIAHCIADHEWRCWPVHKVTCRMCPLLLLAGLDGPPAPQAGCGV